MNIPVLKLENFFRDFVEWNTLPVCTNVEAPHLTPFSVYKRSDNRCKDNVIQSRRDFYKITLVTEGAGEFRLGEQWYQIQPGSLLFINPLQIKEWHATSPQQDGYYCIFPETFLNEPAESKFLKEYPLFGLHHTAVLQLTAVQQDTIQRLFENMLTEFRGDHPHKWSILKHYLMILMLEASGYLPQSQVRVPADSAHQLSVRFLQLLESQFPIESPREQITLRKPMHFAAELHVHVNYLNHAVKETTGNTVSEHIARRIVQEARLLLIHTDWPVNYISWCLGFEDVANFTNFFKKHTGVSPRHQRQMAL